MTHIFSDDFLAHRDADPDASGHRHGSNSRPPRRDAVRLQRRCNITRLAHSRHASNRCTMLRIPTLDSCHSVQDARVVCSYSVSRLRGDAGPNTTGNPLGRGFSSNLSHPYNRLPAEAEGTVRSVIWGESTMPAGLFLQFKTDASCVVVRHTLLSASLAMWHFPSTGVAGMDLYGWDEGNATWRWTGASSDVSSPGVHFLPAALAVCPPLSAVVLALSFYFW